MSQKYCVCVWGLPGADVVTPADEGKLLAELWGVLTETQQCDISRRGAAMKAVLLRYEELGAAYRPRAVGSELRYCVEKWERATKE